MAGTFGEGGKDSILFLVGMVLLLWKVLLLIGMFDLISGTHQLLVDIRSVKL